LLFGRAQCRLLAKASGHRYYLHMRIVVTGDRSWRCDDLAMAILRRLVRRYGRNLTIVHGGEAGVDESFNKACKSLRIAVEVRMATWPRTGNPTIANKNRD
jgi:hypothetical protein